MLLLLAWVAPASAAPIRMDNATDLADTPIGHLLLSELVTGGSSASDEFVEIYNPGAAALPLEGLELVYVTASGATVTRKASWAAGASEIPSHHHVLISNAAGIYAAIADVTYATGLAATGGSLALRIQGAVTAIDAAGWGTAASTWMEGSVAPAPPAGASLERLPGGATGSSQDTDDNLADFAIRAMPDPENSTAAATPGAGASPTPMATATPSASGTQTPDPVASPTPHGSATPSPTPAPSVTPASAPTATPSGSPTATPTASPNAVPTPAPTPISIAAARALPDGSSVTIAGVALTGSAFSDGGGYLDDGSAGIAVLMADGAFDRGTQLIVSGIIDDRYAQRTLRSSAAEVTGVGGGPEPSPMVATTGAVGEATEGRLVAVGGAIQGVPTALSGGLAYDLDDGGGTVRVFVATAGSIDTNAWSRGSTLALVGVVGQRDSSGTGAAGYRVQPRDHGDIVQLLPPPTPSPSPIASASPTASPTPSATAKPSPTPGGGSGVVSIAAARAAGTGTRLRIRGTVTMGSGLLEAGSAVLQDSGAGILIRLGDEAGRLRRGERVELSGTRSTKSGMLTLRVTEPPVSRSAGTEPAPLSLRTGSAGEEQEARLIKVSGAVATAPRRSSAGSLSFDLDDGSGPLRVFVLAAVAPEVTLPGRGAWIEIVGVLGQQTTGALPQRGYRLWPRAAGDVRIVSLPVDAVAGAGASPAGSDDLPSTRRIDDLDTLLPGAPGRAATDAAVGATLVHGSWPELGLAGLLWDGRHLVGLVDGVLAEAAVTDVLTDRDVPAAVQLQAQPAAKGPAPIRLPLITFGSDDRLERSAAAPAAPASSVRTASGPVWARLVGTLTLADGTAYLEVSAGVRVVIERRCADEAPDRRRGLVMVEGILAATGQRLVIGCQALISAPTLRAAAKAAEPVGDASEADASARRGPLRNDTGRGSPAIIMLFSAGAALAGLGLVGWRRGLFQRLTAAARREKLPAPVEPGEAASLGEPALAGAEGRLAPLRLVEPSEEVELPRRG